MSTGKKTTVKAYIPWLKLKFGWSCCLHFSMYPSFVLQTNSPRLIPCNSATKANQTFEHGGNLSLIPRRLPRPLTPLTTPFWALLISHGGQVNYPIKPTYPCWTVNHLLFLLGHAYFRCEAYRERVPRTFSSSGPYLGDNRWRWPGNNRSRRSQAAWSLIPSGKLSARLYRAILWWPNSGLALSAPWATEVGGPAVASCCLVY